MLRVLVVDNDATVTVAVRAGLEEFCGASVLCSDNATEAAELLRRQRLDAAVIDVELPEISGFGLAERAASLNIPVVLTTGHPDGLLLCRRHGFPFIEKPFLPDTLAKQTLLAVRAARLNIARVLASAEQLRRSGTNLREAVEEARRLVAESARNRDRRLRTIKSPLH